MSKSVESTVEALNKLGQGPLVQFLKQYEGQPIAVLAARYNYRGLLSVINENYVILANAKTVEVSGPSGSERPQTEDEVGSFVLIKTDAIEIVYQPKWCFADFKVDNATNKFVSTKK